MNHNQLRARALYNAGRLAHFQSDFPAARSSLEQALELFRQASDETGALNALSMLIVSLTWQGQTDEALILLRQGTPLLPAVRLRPDALTTLSEFGWAASHISAPQSVQQARVLNEEVVQRSREQGEKHSLGLALACLAQCFYWMGNWETAREHYEESIPLLREFGALWMLDYALWGLGQAALQMGDWEAARAISAEAMRRDREVETWVGAPYYLETFAFLSIEQGMTTTAVSLLSAADAMRSRHHSVAQPLVVLQTECYLKKIRDVLSVSEFDAAWKQGRTLTIRDAIALALQTVQKEVAP